MAKIQPIEIDKYELVRELHGYYVAGKTRTEAWEAMRGRRGRTWVKDHWPSRRGSHVLKRSNVDVRRANLLRLLAMAKDGYAERDAIKEFAGVQSETWCRAHWPRHNGHSAAEPEQKEPGSLYGHMNITPRIVYPKRD